MKRDLKDFIVEDNEDHSESDASSGSSDTASTAASSVLDDDSDEGDKKSKKEKKSNKEKKAKVKKEKKKAKTEEGAASKNEEGDTFFSLGGSRRLTVRKWKKSVLVDIREYWTDNNDGGKEKPGKKGISLSVEQWRKIKELCSEIDASISDLQ